jgi:L-rhamnose mutarotase
MRSHALLLPLALLAGCSTPPATPKSAAVSKPAIPPYTVQLPAVAAVHGPSNPVPTPPTSPGVKYFSSIIGLDPAKEKLYRELHANVWPEVVAAIRKANITNFNIYVTEIEGRRYLVSTFEYIGTNPAEDFGSIGQDATTRDKWWPLTDACQIRLPGTPAGEQWRSMEQVMHLP